MASSEAEVTGTAARTTGQGLNTSVEKYRLCAYRVLLDVFDGPRPENHLGGGIVKGLGLVQGNVLSLDNYFRLF